jgi:MFS family permease
VEPQFRGRVLALYLAILQGGTAVGAPLMGWIGSEFGARWSVAAGGAVVLLTGLLAVIVVVRSSRLTMRQQLLASFPRRRAVHGGSGVVSPSPGESSPG